MCAGFLHRIYLKLSRDTQATFSCPFRIFTTSKPVLGFNPTRATQAPLSRLHLYLHPAVFDQSLYPSPQVLKVQPTNPLAWQIALIDSEVDSILGDDGFGRHNHSGAPPPPGPCRKFLRRGAGRTSAGGGGSSKATGGDDAEGGGGGVGDGGGTRRLAIVPGEVCPVCQEEMEDEGDGGDVGGAREVAMEGKLTYCRGGCGNNMHARWVEGGHR